MNEQSGEQKRLPTQHDLDCEVFSTFSKYFTYLYRVNHSAWCHCQHDHSCVIEAHWGMTMT